MSSFRIRPAFSHVMEFDTEETRLRIVGRVEETEALCEFKSFPGFVCLRVPEQDRHFWSPRLNISLDAQDDGNTHVQGTYGPNANMWSSFLYGYLIVGSVGLFSGIFGSCQAVLGMQPWGLWIFGGMLAIGTGMYLMARMGRKLGARQMILLHRIYETAVGREIEIK